MSTQTAVPWPTGPVAPWGLTFTGLLRAEVLKLTSMASTWVMLGLSVGVGMLATAGLNGLIEAVTEWFTQTPGHIQYAFTKVSETMYAAPVLPGAFMALLGIIAVTNEYDSGMIRTSLTITPARWPVLTAKSVVIGVFALSTALIGEFLGAVWEWESAIDHMKFDLFTGVGLHSWLGSSFDVLCFALMGVATGVLVRSTAAAVLSFLLGFMLVLPFLWPLFFAMSSIANLVVYLPSVTAFAVYINMGSITSTGTAVGVMLAWTIAFITGAYVRLMRTD